MYQKERYIPFIELGNEQANGKTLNPWGKLMGILKGILWNKTSQNVISVMWNCPKELLNFYNYLILRQNGAL